MCNFLEGITVGSSVALIFFMILLALVFFMIILLLFHCHLILNHTAFLRFALGATQVSNGEGGEAVDCGAEWTTS
jgi:flagellar biosynthesis protein FliP